MRALFIMHQAVTAEGTRTATAMANEWIPASASTTFELMKPPYDCAYWFPASNHVPIPFKSIRCMRICRDAALTQPQIPTRFGST